MKTAIGEISKPLRVGISLGLVAVVVLMLWCFVYRLPVGAPLLAIVSFMTFLTQAVEAHHDWPTYKTATKKTSRLLVLSFLIVTALYAALNAKASWDTRPRYFDRITEWRISRDLAKFKGTPVQVLASGIGYYSDACNLKFQIEGILQRAGWVTQSGECNRFPAQFGRTLIIQYDTKGQDAALALFRYVSTQGWKSVSAGLSPNRAPMIPTLGATPFNGDSGILVQGAKPVDVLVQVYDNVH